MPIIGKVGRKSFKMRALNTTIHVVLLLGALTMIYPFLIMVSSSFKSNVDAKSFSLYPRFFFDEEMLFRKYVEARMNEESTIFQQQYKSRFFSVDFLSLPTSPNRKQFNDWQQFLEQTASTHTLFDFGISEQFGRGIYPRNDRAFRNAMKKENDNSLEAFNQRYDEAILSWDEVRVEEKDMLFRKFSGDYSGILARYETFRTELPLWHRVYHSLDGHFIANELATSYRGNLDAMNAQLGTQFASWDAVTLSRHYPQNGLQNHWAHYVKKILNIHHIGVKPLALTAYQTFIQQKYDDISLLNQTYKTTYTSFSTVPLPDTLPRSGAQLVDWAFFIENIAEPQWLYIKSVSFDFRDWLAEKYSTIDELNAAYARGYQRFSAIPLDANLPTHNVTLAADWQRFVQQHAAAEHVQLQMISQMAWQEFLLSRFALSDGTLDLATLNSRLGTSYDTAINIYPAATLPAHPQYRELWLEFIMQPTSAPFLQIDAAESTAWHQFLASRYPDVDALNHAYGLVYSSFDDVTLDQWTQDYFTFKAHKSTIFWEFVKRNYVMVLDMMLYNGRAIINTLIYCGLAIITALLINPLAAYAMSRFKMRATYKIILVLMLTMAFPPMVMGIPNFLILKKLNLLNTFLALILPGAADGYFIFLLKGFFDSLPKELFESATIDGASEKRIFWQIAMSLSKPIMAVIALGAFNAAYRNFMFAFIVCQDQSMWTMMVHIYQLMQRSAAGVGFAALVIAAIPTFAVFVFFQNIIIKGIVVPTEK